MTLSRFLVSEVVAWEALRAQCILGAVEALRAQCILGAVWKRVSVECSISGKAATANIVFLVNNSWPQRSESSIPK